LTDGPGFLFVLPSFSRRAASVDPFWITASGLACALGSRLDGADVLTPDGVLSPDEMSARVVQGGEEGGALGKGVRHLPQPARVGLGDMRAWRRARQMRALQRSVADRPYRLVMQLHRRFQDVGFAVARARRVPIVLRVDALEVQEEASWGVRRPGWSRIVETLGELNLIRRADLVAAVSEDVDDQLAALGIEDERRVVVPSGVDLDSFSPGDPDRELRGANGLDGRFLVGWLGGFRPFHGLQAVPEIARGLRSAVPGAVLCVVGTGPLRDRLTEQVRGLEEVVRIIDPVPHGEVPRWLRTFDACLLLADAGPYHYSPLKLYEYLGCGRPVIAPRIGEMERILSDGQDAVLVRPENPSEVVAAVAKLAGDPAFRARIGRRARLTAERIGSWRARADTVLSVVEDRGLLSRQAWTSTSHG
jgi:glycosyltransferase involved in cell wall biosynthesis